MEVGAFVLRKMNLKLVGVVMVVMVVVVVVDLVVILVDVVTSLGGTLGETMRVFTDKKFVS